MTGSRIILTLLFAMFGVIDPAEAQTLQRLTLEQARQAALANHPQVRAATFDALAETQVAAQRSAARFPVVQADLTGAGANPEDTIAAGQINNSSVDTRGAAGLRVDQLIYDFGRTSNLVRSARSRARAAEQTSETTRAQVILEVDRAYFTALRAQALLEVAEQTVQTRRLVLEQTQALQQTGIRSGLDVSMARYSLAEAQLQLSRSENDFLAALANLSAAMGVEEERPYQLVDEPLPDRTLPDREEIIAEASQNRPDLRALRLERDAAYQFLAAEKALRRPSITAAAVAGLIPFHNRDLDNRYNAVGVNIDIPILGGGRRARAREADYRARASEERVRNAEIEIARDARVAWYNADSAFQRIGLAAQLLSHAKESFDLAQERYRLGLASIVELSQAVLSLTVAEIESANARFEYRIQRSILDYQRGQLP